MEQAAAQIENTLKVSSKMKLLIIGSGGQVGEKIAEKALSEGHDVYGTYKSRQPTVALRGSYLLDKVDRVKVDKLVSEVRPDVIIDTGALHNVDYCETHSEEAFAINRDGARNLAMASKSVGAKYIFVSTDYVFDGKSAPYTEESKTGPLSVYALSKIQGEENALYFNGPNSIVVRPSVIYSWVPTLKQRESSSSEKPLNFASWLVIQLRANKEVNIVDDQIASPTLADDLARAILALCESSKASGVFHTAGSTSLSRFDFSLRTAEKLGLQKDLIHPIKTTSLNQRAKRPMDSSLLSERMRKELQYGMMELDKALAIFASQAAEDLKA